MVRRVPFQLLPVGEPFLDQFAGLRVMDGTAFHDHFGRPHCAPPGPTSEAAWVCFPGFPISNKMTTRLFSTGLCRWTGLPAGFRSEEHTSELQSRFDLVCRLLLEKKKKTNAHIANLLHRCH